MTILSSNTVDTIIMSILLVTDTLVCDLEILLVQMMPLSQDN